MTKRIILLLQPFPERGSFSQRTNFPNFCPELLRSKVMNGIKDAEIGVETLIRELRAGAILIDVRSPSEYAKGHVPGAANLPLFDDKQRGKMLTVFAKQNHELALAMARRVLRPELQHFLTRVMGMVRSRRRVEYSRGSTSKMPFVIYLYCWRGGMRSRTLAWFLMHSARPGLLDCHVIRNGYKAFKHFVSSRWSTLTQEELKGDSAAEASSGFRRMEPCIEGPWICIIGGRTGVGKTRVLHALRDAGERVIDLEGVARHRGSAFGWVGHSSTQPPSEHFSNLLAIQWVSQTTPKWIFIEDEGPHVGKCSVHPALFQRMRCAPLVINIVAEKQTRLHVLLEDYVTDMRDADNTWSRAMLESVGKLHRRLGRDQTEALQLFLHARNYMAFADGLLQYYDNMYDMHLGKSRADGRALRRIGADVEAVRRRQGKIKEVHAFPVGRHSEKLVTNPHPGSLDIHRLTKDVLTAVLDFVTNRTSP